MTRKNAKRSERNKVVLVGILSVVLAALLLRPTGGSAQKPGEADTAEVNSAPAAPAVHMYAIDATTWEPPGPLPATVPDPMYFLIPEPVVEEKLEEAVVEEPQDEEKPPEREPITISGIVYSETRPSAIINGALLYVGDHVQGARIIAIHKDTIELERNGETWQQAVREKK